MIQDTLRSIGGIGLYGIISIGLFFTVFLGMLIWVFRLKKNYLNSMGALPIEHDSESDLPSTSTIHRDPRHD